MFVEDQQLCLNHSIYHKQIQDDSTRFESQTNNRLTGETWAQILVLSLFFEFLGLVWITTSNLGTSTVGNFLDSMRWECFRTNKTSKGVCLGRKVRLNANMYSFNNIYLFFSLCLCSKQHSTWIKSLTFDRGEFHCRVWFLERNFFFSPQSENSISCVRLKCLETWWNKPFQSKTTTTAN